MATDKDQLHALLADYVEGSLDERQIDEAEAYLNANPAVRTVVERLMVDSEALRALPQQRSPVDYSEDVRAAAERDLLLGDPAAAGSPRRPLSGPMLALAAMLVVGIGIGGASYWVLTHRPQSRFDLATTVGRDAPVAATAADERASTSPALPSDAMAKRMGDERPDAMMETAAAREGATMARRAAATPELAEGPMAAAAAPVPPPAIAPMPATPGVVGGAAGGLTEWPPELESPRGAGGGGGVNPTTPAASATPAAAAPVTALAAATDEVPATVRAIIDAAPVEGGRRAVAIAVDDAAEVEPMRRLVRSVLAPQNLANNVYENVGPTNVLAATLPADLGPLVAVDVPPGMASRVRAAIDLSAAGGTPAARVYELTPARAEGKASNAESALRPEQAAAAADDAARARNATRADPADSQQQYQRQQQISGEVFAKDGDGVAKAKENEPHAATNVDVFVLLVPTENAPASAPATMPAP